MCRYKRNYVNAAKVVIYIALQKKLKKVFKIFIRPILNVQSF